MKHKEFAEIVSRRLLEHEIDSRPGLKQNGFVFNPRKASFISDREKLTLQGLQEIAKGGYGRTWAKTILLMYEDKVKKEV